MQQDNSLGSLGRARRMRNRMQRDDSLGSLSPVAGERAG
jgi:hypothetical protein